ncbi:MAG: hypothetical protein GEU79_07130 [Acidimicrobiia bacterium]|nr:hypothetical protein [Acidimicrobiia bacterium]
MSVFVVENRAVIRLLMNAARDGPMIYAVPPECRIAASDLDVKNARASRAVEKAFGNVTSAASSTLTNAATWRELDPSRSLADMGSSLASQLKARQAIVELPTSGIKLHLYSEYVLEIDEEALDRLWHASLMLDEELADHPTLRNLVGCYRRNIIEERRFEGTDYHMFILSRNECWRAVRLQERPSGVDRTEFCDSSAVTPPNLGEISFMGRPMFPVWASLNNLMVLTPNAGDPNDVDALDRHLNSFLLHESIHVPDRLMGNQWWADPEERKVQYLESLVDEHLFESEAPEPISIIDL